MVIPHSWHADHLLATVRLDCPTTQQCGQQHRHARQTLPDTPEVWRSVMTIANVAIVLFIVTAAVLPSVAQLPQGSHAGDVETLEIAGGAVEAVLARERPPHCSVILLTDGTTSATTVFTELGRLRIPLGLVVIEVAGEDKNPNKTQAQLSWMVGEALRLRQVSGCVTLVVVSDDPAFLAASAEWSLKGRLLTWPNKLLAVTRRPLQDLRHLYTSFSMMNSMLIIVDNPAGFYRCKVYTHPPYRPPAAQVVRVASWSTVRGLTLATHLPLFPEKFSKFAYGPSFVAVAEEYPFYVERDPAWTPSQPLSYVGPVVQLLDLLAENTNFTYTFVRPPDGKWGTKEADGSWTGMVGMVGRKEVDMGVGPFSLSAVRAEMVDYMSLFVGDALKIIGGRGRPEVDPWGFLLPLGPLVWTAILAALLVVPGLVLLLLLCSPRKAPQGNRRQMETFLYFRILLRQGYMSHPGELWPERLVLGSWMVMALVLNRSYDGNLMSMLAVRYIPQPYQSLRDVLDDPSITMVWLAGSVYMLYLRTMKTGALGEVMDTMKEGRLMLVTTTEYRQVLETLVAEGTHVLIIEENEGRSIRADVFSDTGRCDFYTSREHFLPNSMSMIGQKGHPLIPALSKSIKFVKQFGIFDYWLESFKVNATRCLRPSSKITIKSSLSVYNLWGMFVVLAGGHAIALLLLCLELLVAPLIQTNSSPASTDY